jgi:hypothetical protein
LKPELLSPYKKRVKQAQPKLKERVHKVRTPLPKIEIVTVNIRRIDSNAPASMIAPTACLRCGSGDDIPRTQEDLQRAYDRQCEELREKVTAAGYDISFSKWTRPQSVNLTELQEYWNVMG